MAANSNIQKYVCLCLIPGQRKVILKTRYVCPASSPICPTWSNTKGETIELCPQWQMNSSTHLLMSVWRCSLFLMFSYPAPMLKIYYIHVAIRPLIRIRKLCLQVVVPGTVFSDKLHSCPGGEDWTGILWMQTYILSSSNGHTEGFMFCSALN